jgi:hypothetical protein
MDTFMRLFIFKAAKACADVIGLGLAGLAMLG